MPQDSWLSCEKSAVLQGGFLLASRQCQPASLCALRKEDWGHVGRPVVQAVTEVCGQVQAKHQDLAYWRKKIVCTIWSKALETERGGDVDRSWKENPMFAILNGLCDLSHTVLFELVKSAGFSDTYVELLLCLQPTDLCVEVQHLVQHVTTDTTAEDTLLLLRVWRQLWRGKKKPPDGIDEVFAGQFSNDGKSSDFSSQASKRFKLDSDSVAAGKCVVSKLFRALSDIKDKIGSSELCHFALCNCLDTLYTSFMLEHVVELTAEEKLRQLSAAVSVQRKRSGTEEFDLVEAVSEAQRDLSAVHSPSKFKPEDTTLTRAAQSVLSFLNVWEDKGFLEVSERSGPSSTVLHLRTVVDLVLRDLRGLSAPPAPDEEHNVACALRKALQHLADVLLAPEPEISLLEMARVAEAVIDHRLEDYREFTALFASELSRAFTVKELVDSLERNKSAFQEKAVVMKLVSTLIARCRTDADVRQCRRLKAVILDLFSELPLDEKNQALAEVLTLSPNGLHGHLPHAVTDGFNQELNLAFNCMVQDAGESGSGAAVSAVARVAFQDPEATLRRCCRLAVTNLGSHGHISQILRRLPGLGRGAGLLCRCLLELWGKLASAREEQQFLGFLGGLTGGDGDAGFASAEEVLRAFVLPHLSAAPHHPKLELCLRLLHSTLERGPGGGTRHWVMNLSPFPLLCCLCQLLNDCCRCWETGADGPRLSIECKELLTSILSTLGGGVGKEVAADSSAWSRELFWLHRKVEALDWTVRFRLKAVWGDHFKNEVPDSLLAVCALPERSWAGLALPRYGEGTGLLAWLECCCVSDELQEAMLDHLRLDLRSPEDVNMFSKGLLVAVSQTLPWCTAAEWERLLKAVRRLLRSGQLHAPYSLEYVDFLPLLDLRPLAGEMRLSVFLLRVFQLLCGSSCADWLPPHGWSHAARLYAAAVRETLGSLKLKAPVQSPEEAEPGSAAGAQELCFVLTQLFCHVLHVQVMMPGQGEALFLCSLEILALYEGVLAAHPNLSSSLEADNTRHFLTTIADNLECADRKAVLQQKIAQLSL